MAPGKNTGTDADVDSLSDRVDDRPSVRLRDKIMDLHKKVDKLLNVRAKKDAPVQSVNEKSEEVEEQPPLNAEEANSVTDDEDDDEDDSDEDSEDEDMAELLVKSLHMHHAITSKLDGQQAIEPRQEQLDSKNGQPRSEHKDTETLEVSWCPKTGLPVEPSSDTKKLQNMLKHPENVLEDKLFVPSRSVRQLNKLAKKNIPDTAGPKWYNMPAKTLTPELRRELQLIKLRGVLDPKHHYKREESKGLPKYFQIGTVVEGPGEFYSSRLTRKERKTSIADELLADSNVQAYRKRKYVEIMDKSQAGGKKYLKQRDHRKKPSWVRRFKG